ncbi:MAG: sulfurtransferase [Proteobacteria bacterium]|nr:sulfurtransferase [Pseudomonadota bacterium]MBU1739916.1 sulfurtransferase [Pseudomonadota bacterium]
MKWKQFLTPVAKMTPEELRRFMDERSQGDYTLLDVREPGEYEAGHLPGARLIPVTDVSDRIKELDPDKPTVAYCAIGGRSRVAAQYLSGRGFREVYNLMGGLKAWEGAEAFGPPETGLIEMTGDETETDFLIWAYSQEKGLQEFYRATSHQMDSREAAELFLTLADVEDKHQQRIYKLFQAVNPGAGSIEEFEAEIETKYLEGGLTTEEFLGHYRPALDGPAEVVMLAMAIETQALDLYLRFAQMAAEPGLKDTVMTLAGDEREHLKHLGQLLDTMT